MNEGRKGTQIISPNKIWDANKHEIQQLLLQIAKQNNVSVQDAAQALQIAVQRLTGGIAP